MFRLSFFGLAFACAGMSAAVTTAWERILPSLAPAGERSIGVGIDKLDHAWHVTISKAPLATTPVLHIARINKLGTILWDAVYDFPPISGEELQPAVGFFSDTLGNGYLTFSHRNFSATPIYLKKISGANGSVLAQVTLPRSGVFSGDVQTDAAGNVYVAREVGANSTMMLAKYTSNLVYQWQTGITSGSYHVMPDGQSYVIDPVVRRYGTDGKLNWNSGVSHNDVSPSAAKMGPSLLYFIANGKLRKVDGVAKTVSPVLDTVGYNAIIPLNSTQVVLHGDVGIARHTLGTNVLTNLNAGEGIYWAGRLNDNEVVAMVGDGWWNPLAFKAVRTTNSQVRWTREFPGLESISPYTSASGLTAVGFNGPNGATASRISYTDGSDQWSNTIPSRLGDTSMSTVESVTAPNGDLICLNRSTDGNITEVSRVRPTGAVAWKKLISQVSLSGDHENYRNMAMFGESVIVAGYFGAIRLDGATGATLNLRAEGPSFPYFVAENGDLYHTEFPDEKVRITRFNPTTFAAETTVEHDDVNVDSMVRIFGDATGFWSCQFDTTASLMRYRRYTRTGLARGSGTSNQVHYPIQIGEELLVDNAANWSRLRMVGTTPTQTPLTGLPTTFRARAGAFATGGLFLVGAQNGAPAAARILTTNAMSWVKSFPATNSPGAFVDVAVTAAGDPMMTGYRGPANLRRIISAKLKLADGATAWWIASPNGPNLPASDRAGACIEYSASLNAAFVFGSHVNPTKGDVDSLAFRFNQL